MRLNGLLLRPGGRFPVPDHVGEGLVVRGEELRAGFCRPQHSPHDQGVVDALPMGREPRRELADELLIHRLEPELDPLPPPGRCLRLWRTRVSARRRRAGKTLGRLRPPPARPKASSGSGCSEGLGFSWISPWYQQTHESQQSIGTIHYFVRDINETASWRISSRALPSSALQPWPMACW